MHPAIQALALRLLTALNLVPKPLLDVSTPMMRARIIFASVRLGVYDVLAQGPKTLAQLASVLQVQPNDLQLLLDALVGFGYLKGNRGVYANSRMANKYLVPTSPYFVGTMVLFQEEADALTQALSAVIKTGTVAQGHAAYLNDDTERWRRYVVGMREGARMSLREVIAKIPIDPGDRRLLDLGGSHGLYACTLCERYPDLEAVVLDQAGAITVSESLVANSPARTRVTLQAGDLWQDDYGGPYDVILLFAILHLFSPDRNRELLGRVAHALRPGGTLVIADFLADRLAADWIASFSLGMRCFFGEGQAYPSTTIRTWLAETGFEVPRVRHLRNPASLLITRKR